MISYTDINVLGNLINSTFGRQSSNAGSTAIRAKLAGDKLVVVYHEVVNIARDADKHTQVNDAKQRAVQEVKKYVASVKTGFKKDAGHVLNLKSAGEASELEAMSYNFLSPVRPSLFRYTATYEIE